jgi:hypothetical protein
MRAFLRPGALAVLVWALAAPTALAHEGNPNFRSEVDGLHPAVQGIDVEVLNFDDSLRLDNRSDETVVVEGYEHEPYIRIAADGTVAVNERSPAYYLNQDRFAEVDVPGAADPDAPPRWRVVDETSQYAWHDHRAHYMGEGTPPQVSDASERTKVFDYEIPLRVSGERVRLTGTLVWVGEDDDGVPLAPLVAVGVSALGCGAILVARRRRLFAAGRDHGVEREETEGGDPEAW